jgi:hypothetical protein
MFDNIRRIVIPGIFLLWALTGPAPIARADTTPHGHDCNSATEIALNTDIRSALADKTDFAVYRMVLEQRGLIDVWTDPGSFDVSGMDLLDSSCKAVPGVFPGTSVITGQYSKITVPSLNVNPAESVWTLDPGVYFIRLHPNPARVFRKPFTIHNRFTPHYGHECKTAEPVEVTGVVDTALLYPQDQEMFRVTTETPGRIYAWITGPLAASKEPVISSYFPDCSRAADRLLHDQSGTVTTVILLEPGTYYLSVEPGKPDALRSFTLHLEFVPEFIWL